MIENGEQMQKICDEFRNNIRKINEDRENSPKEFQLCREELNLILMELKKGLAKNKAKSFVTKAEETNSADKLLFKMEVVEFDMADPKIKIIEINSDKIDVDHVDGFYYEVDSDGVDNSFIVESENAMKKTHHYQNISGTSNTPKNCLLRPKILNDLKTKRKKPVEIFTFAVFDNVLNLHSERMLLTHNTGYQLAPFNTIFLARASKKESPPKFNAYMMNKVLKYFLVGTILQNKLENNRFHKDAKNYGQFLRTNKGIGSPPTEDEHIAFLLMWLCKNIFCVLASKIMLQFIDIAKSLATGKPASLGPLGKWSPNWEGPYMISKVVGKGAYQLHDKDDGLRYSNLINGRFLKKYCPSSWETHRVDN
ncbi:hypothetical protein FNV43_RR24722 [Rhamnella rubrinervis]|uniref:Uncharacterized protein n=1 Tax=Rhamnella rubrinervis TaxID=2594499 RepID=A0A8K0DSU4_9ROSA|nr:hypothetical protein FNV43_RR24722 [Rhamnella rubrinervis]